MKIKPEIVANGCNCWFYPSMYEWSSGPDITSCITISCIMYIHLLLEKCHVCTYIISRYFRVYTDILSKVLKS